MFLLDSLAKCNAFNYLCFYNFHTQFFIDELWILKMRRERLRCILLLISLFTLYFTILFIDKFNIDFGTITSYWHRCTLHQNEVTSRYAIFGDKFSTLGKPQVLWNLSAPLCFCRHSQWIIFPPQHSPTLFHLRYALSSLTQPIAHLLFHLLFPEESLPSSTWGFSSLPESTVRLNHILNTKHRMEGCCCPTKS